MKILSKKLMHDTIMNKILQFNKKISLRIIITIFEEKKTKCMIKNETTVPV